VKIYWIVSHKWYYFYSQNKLKVYSSFSFEILLNILKLLGCAWACLCSWHLWCCIVWGSCVDSTVFLFASLSGHPIVALCTAHCAVLCWPSLHTTVSAKAVLSRCSFSLSCLLFAHCQCHKWESLKPWSSFVVETAWNRILLEMLIFPQLVKKSSTFYGTWRFMTVFTRAHHLSVSWARSIQSMAPPPWPSYLLKTHCDTISHLHLHLTRGLFPSGFLANALYAFLLFSTHASCTIHHILCDLSLAATWIANFRMNCNICNAKVLLQLQKVCQRRSIFCVAA
jgi:hypothetical protein